MLTRASHGIVFSGLISGLATKGKRGTAREKTRTREARLTATRSAANVESLVCWKTERNRSEKTSRMCIERPIGWNGRSTGLAGPGIAMKTSARVTRARYASRYVHREARTDATWGVDTAVAMPHSSGCPTSGSIGTASYDSRASKYRYGVAAACPMT